MASCLNASHILCPQAPANDDACLILTFQRRLAHGLEDLQRVPMHDRTKWSPDRASRDRSKSSAWLAGWLCSIRPNRGGGDTIYEAPLPFVISTDISGANEETGREAPY